MNGDVRGSFMKQMEFRVFNDDYTPGLVRVVSSREIEVCFLVLSYVEPRFFCVSVFFCSLRFVFSSSRMLNHASSASQCFSVV